MKSLIVGIMLLIGVLGISGCNDTGADKASQNQSNPKKMTITEDTLKQILNAFNKHDLDLIMKYFSEECTFDFPRGTEYYGQRYTGIANVREALASRFKNIPDVQYSDDKHWISEDGSRGVSEWTLTGTTILGVKLKVRGCDHWEFQNGKISRKDSYWKIVENPFPVE